MRAQRRIAASPYEAYSVASDGTTARVARAVAAPFDPKGVGLVMWSRIDGTSAAVYAGAVERPP